MKELLLVATGWLSMAFVFSVVAPRIYAQTAEQKPAVQWADITLAPNLTVVILRDTAPPGDRVIVTTFFWADIKGIDKPVMRSVTDVIGAIRNTAVGANGAPDPSKVATVHVDMVTTAARMEWKPPAVQP